MSLGLGVDVGGTTIKAGLVDTTGKLTEQVNAPTPALEGPEAVLHAIGDLITPLLDNYSKEIRAIGLGVPGMVNNRGDVAYPPNFPGWEVVPVEKQIRPMLNTVLPIVVDNDANVAAYAEATIGSGKDVPDFLFVTLGTGIGGCIIYDRQIWRGETGGAGEIGHVTVDMNGRPCNCGSKGCVEAYVGQKYMTSIALERLADMPDSLLHGMLSQGKEMEPKLINEAAEAGDSFAREFLAEMGEILGAGLASAMNMTDLHTVIIGGGMAQAETYLLTPARHSLRHRLLKRIADDVDMRTASLGNESGMVGAALLAFAVV